MKCRWCRGTGGECGCGEGYCMHCDGKGNVADWPFDITEQDLIDSGTEKKMEEIFSENWVNGTADDIKQTVQRFSKVTTGKCLTEEEADTFVTFFEQPNRDTTVGIFAAIVICYAKRVHL